MSAFGNPAKENEGHVQFHLGPYDADKNSRENSTAVMAGDPPSKGSTRTSDHPMFWSGMYPSYFPNQERAPDKRINPGPAQANPNWAVFSSAASSGFSFSASPPSPALAMSAPGLLFTPPSTTGASQFYCPVKAPP